MTKEEIALQLTIECKNLIKVGSDSYAKDIADFYNTIFDNIKTEHSEKISNMEVLK